jgi:hypothetical protein
LSTLYEQIREANRLKRMRLGQDAPEMVELPAHPELRVAQVPLSERETQAGLIAAAQLNVPDNHAGLQARDRLALTNDVWHSLRQPDDLSRKIFPSVETMVEELEPEEVDYLANKLTILMNYASPAIDGLTDEQLNELKKALAAIDLSALTGRQWAAMKLCLSVLSPQLLAASLSGSFSTDLSTMTNGNDEST